MGKSRKQDPLPDSFETTDEFAEFWDTHSTADYPEAFRPVKSKVRVLRRRFYRVTLDPQLGSKLEERARAEGVTLDALVNQMLQDKLHPAA